MKTLLTILIFTLLISSVSYATHTRTFSCNGTYTTKEGKLLNGPHAEQNYEENLSGKEINLQGLDNIFEIKGYLIIKGGEEFLKVSAKIISSGIIAYNNNSQLGQGANNEFNFVEVGLENLDRQTTVTKAKFQCQSYRN